jgi:uncharacterized membrane protein YheB (UPF0754 family)
MLSLAEVWADVQQYWVIYLSMPFVAALIGYGTKLVAIRMMFEPIEFVGWKPYFGWQGIVPRKAEVMAGIACDTMTRRLLTPADVFGRLDPARVTAEIEKPLTAAVEDITREVVAQYSPGLLESAPDVVRRALIRRVQADAPDYVAQIMGEIKNNIDQVFDLRDMVTSNLTRDKELLNRVFREVGRKEFQFIARSGIWFGLAIGVVQAVVWAFTQNPWVMPLFGGFTGWFTDWLALKMVFRPKKPTKYLFGLFEWQGMFLRRRKEVAAEYGALIADEIITPRNIIDAVLKGPLSDRLYSMVLKNVQKMVDEQAGPTRPLIVLAVGSVRFQEMKKLIAARLLERMPEAMKHVERYAEDSMDLKRTLVTKMQELNEEEFENLLRPAFQQDEWILIAVGAVLGFLVGELQVQIMLAAR